MANVVDEMDINIAPFADEEIVAEVIDEVSLSNQSSDEEFESGSKYEERHESNLCGGPDHCCKLITSPEQGMREVVKAFLNHIVDEFEIRTTRFNHSASGTGSKVEENIERISDDVENGARGVIAESLPEQEQSKVIGEVRNRDAAAATVQEDSKVRNGGEDDEVTGLDQKQQSKVSDEVNDVKGHHEENLGIPPSVVEDDSKTQNVGTVKGCNLCYSAGDDTSVHVELVDDQRDLKLETGTAKDQTKFSSEDALDNNNEDNGSDGTYLSNSDSDTDDYNIWLRRNAANKSPRTENESEEKGEDFPVTDDPSISASSSQKMTQATREHLRNYLKSSGLMASMNQALSNLYSDPETPMDVVGAFLEKLSIQLQLIFENQTLLDEKVRIQAKIAELTKKSAALSEEYDQRLGEKMAKRQRRRTRKRR